MHAWYFLQDVIPGVSSSEGAMPLTEGSTGFYLMVESHEGAP